MTCVYHHKQLTLRPYPVADGVKIDIQFVVRQMLLAMILRACFPICVVRNPTLVQPVRLIIMHIRHLLTMPGIMHVHHITLPARSCHPL